MTTKQLEKIAEDLGIEYYHSLGLHVILEGINGHGTILYSDKYVKDKPNLNIKPATMEDFSKHLKQMGRDSLKMELNNLLSITNHA